MALASASQGGGNARSNTSAHGGQRNAADGTAAWKRCVRHGLTARSRLSTGWTARADCREAHHFTRPGLRLGTGFLPVGPRSVRLGPRAMGTAPTRASRLGACALGARSTRLVCRRGSLEINPKKSNEPQRLRGNDALCLCALGFTFPESSRTRDRPSLPRVRTGN